MTNSLNDLARKGKRLQQLLQSDTLQLYPVVELAPHERLVWLDLSGTNSRLAAVRVADTDGLDAFITREIARQKGVGGIGGYLENRKLYLRSTVFAGEEHRTLHLGVDIWLPAQTAVHTPLEGKIHSFADNAGFGNYGPTILLEHRLKDLGFYTLYGHLSRQSLQGLQEGQPVQAGQQIGTLGMAEENGDWPPHLHFQIMLDMEGNKGDYPGVAAPSQAEQYRLRCPDPNLLLRVPK